MNTSDAIRALAKYFQDTKPEGLVSVYVFGSEAEGRSHRESDVDLGILFARNHFDSPAARFDERLRLAADLSPIVPRREIDIVILNDAPPQLARKILTGEHQVFCSDKDADFAFRVYTLSRAADLEPFLQRMRRIKLDALGRS